MYSSHYEMMQFLTERWENARLSARSSVGKKKDMMQFKHEEIVTWSRSHFSKPKIEAKPPQKKEIQKK